MEYYPINLRLKDRRCLVVGGGAVATRKVRVLLACGAVVTVVSPEVDDALAGLADEGRLDLERRPYQSSDLNGVFLVIGATDDQAVNKTVSQDAARLNTLCNIADQPDLCNFILPAVVTRGDLTLTVSTAGRSPAAAKWLRKRLERQYGAEYAELLVLLGGVRQKMMAESLQPEANKHRFETLLDSDLLTLIRNRDVDGIDGMLRAVFGPDYHYASVMPPRNAPPEDDGRPS